MTGYRVLCGLAGFLLASLGAAAYAAFFAYQAPGGRPPAGFEMGPHGIYFVAFTGSALVAWGLALLAAARHPAGTRGLGTATATGLVLMAFYRMVAWLVGDYASVGDLLRVEAGVFLALALAFLWLRPAHPEAL